MLLRRSPRGVVSAAPAKINLALDVLGKRADGFHEIDTVFAAVSLFDGVALAPLDDEPGVRIEIDPRSTAPGRELVPTDGSNIVAKAAAALRERVGDVARPGVRISLLKNIPVQAGLGGGSSDAASTLVGLNALWRCGLAIDELAEIGAGLGSDVPFFVRGRGTARGTGRGERITSLPPPPPLDLVLAKPGSGLSAGAVYAEYEDSTESPRADAVTASLGNRRRLADACGNDLEPPAVRLQNEVAGTLDRLSRRGGGRAIMSGSGTTCFAFSGTTRAARVTARACRDATTWTAAVKTLNRF